jgi:hypothetical protein
MSSYSSPAAQGSAQGTGAYSVSVAAQAGGTNTDGHSTDSAGNLQIDFVWGNNPLRPNDERTTTSTPSYNATGGTTGSTVNSIPGIGADYGWGTTTDIASSALAFSSISKAVNNVGTTYLAPADNHVISESGYSSFPSFSSGEGNFMVTAVSCDGTNATYTSQNWFAPGNSINITGLTNSTYNVSNGTVVSATRQSFTVANTNALSTPLTGQLGKAEYYGAQAATDGSFVSGTAYTTVPNVLGKTTAIALKELDDAELVVTTASSYTPAISNVALTSNVVTVTTAAAHGFAVGDSATIAAVTNTAINGTFTLTAVTSTTLSYALTHANISSGSDTGTAKVAARSGTIFTQSVAAGTASVSAGAAITITPWA